MKKLLAIMMVLTLMTSMVFAIEEVGKIETHDGMVIGRVGIDESVLRVQVMPDYFILDAKGDLAYMEDEFPTTKKSGKKEGAANPNNPKLGKFELKYEFDWDLDDGHPPVMKEMLMKDFGDTIPDGTMVAVKVEVIRDVAFIRVHNRWAGLQEEDPGYGMSLEDYLKMYYPELIMTGWLVGEQFDDDRNWASYAIYEMPE